MTSAYRQGCCQGAFLEVALFKPCGNRGNPPRKVDFLNWDLNCVGTEIVSDFFILSFEFRLSR